MGQHHHNQPRHKKKAPFDLTAPLNRKSYKRELNAQTNLEFRPLERELGSEQAASEHRMNAEIPAWYQGYQADLAKLRGESTAASNNATQTVANFSNQGAAQDATNRNAIMERMQADAQLRGTTVDPSVDVGIANAEGARHNVQTSVLGTLAGQGANQSNYLANQQGTAGLQAIEQRQAEAARGRKIYADQRELAAKKGDFRTAFRNTARESERKYSLGNATISGQNWRAKLSAKTSSGNNKRSTSATMRGQDISSADRAKARHQTAVQKKKDRANANWRDTHDGKKKKKKR